MNPVNATALYVSASRAVLQCDPRRAHTFAEMYRLLPFLRQSLACLVCGKGTLLSTVLKGAPVIEHQVCFRSHRRPFQRSACDVGGGSVVHPRCMLDGSADQLSQSTG